MKTTVEKIELLKEATMGCGIYAGTWSGYQAEVITNDGKWRLRTVDGIRGVAKCKVTVDQNHIATVEVVKR